MLRKLRRLRVPVCFYTCCSLFAILLFVSFNEDVKNLIQQSSSHHRRTLPSAPQGYASSFSLASSSQFSSSGARGGNPRPLISSNPSGSAAISTGNGGSGSGNEPQTKPSSQRRRSEEDTPKKSLPAEQYLNEKRKGGGGGGDGLSDDEDAMQQYINDNFIRHREQQAMMLAEEKERLTTEKQDRDTTNVISNLVKLAQQASNNPNAFQNINSLTGDTVSGLQADTNEPSQTMMDGAQSTTAESELMYPGGDTNSQMRKRERQWFMTGGDYFPTPPGGLSSIFYPSAPWPASKPSTEDYANLWYDSSSGSDRVIEQLMFAIDDPINYANISWGFDGPTATTVRPSGAALTQEPDVQSVPQNGNSIQQSEGEGRKASGWGTGKSGADRSGSLTALSSVSRHKEYAPFASSFNERINRDERYENMLYANGMSSPSRDPRLGKIKTILLYYGLGMSWGSHITNGRQVFLQQKCPVNACRLTGNRAQLSKADLVVFKDVFMHPKIKRPPGQLWVMYMLECPLNTQNFLEKNAFNLTATYRHDSDIVTPYEKWVYFEDSVRSLPQAINYAEGKTKKVAWFVSNCVAKNNRLEYARELAKYIEVDIYGACGSHTCSRANAKQCFEMLSRNYKFYLAFENSNCRDYISEKFFVNGLGNNVLPIVMGAHPDDYKRVAPDRSYIHVDDFSSPKELAQYLHELDTNDDLYNEYFKWKGTGEFINTHFFCRLCAMAHYSSRSPRKPSHYEDFNRWWRGPHICTRHSWRSTPDIFAPENYEAVISHSHH